MKTVKSFHVKHVVCITNLCTSQNTSYSVKGTTDTDGDYTAAAAATTTTCATTATTTATTTTTTVTTTTTSQLV